MKLKDFDKNISFHHIPSDYAINMLPIIQKAGIFQNDDSYVIKRKKYDSLLLVCTISGRGYLKYDKKEYPIKENEGFIIDCNRPQVYFTARGNSWKFAWIHFKGIEASMQVDYILKSQGPILKPVENELALNQIYKIIEIFPEKGLSADIKLSICINKILSNLLINCSASNNISIPNEINATLKFIEANYNSKLSVDKLSKEIYINKFDLIRKFKRYIGLTPYEYLIKYRLSVAKKLIETTSNSITEIATSTGFESLSYFIKVFKEHEKTTPAKYRRLF